MKLNSRTPNPAVLLWRTPPVTCCIQVHGSIKIIDKLSSENKVMNEGYLWCDVSNYLWSHKQTMVRSTLMGISINSFPEVNGNAASLTGTYRSALLVHHLHFMSTSAPKREVCSIGWAGHRLSAAPSIGQRRGRQLV